MLARVRAAAFALPLFLALAGCEILAADHAARAYPTQGRLVDLGDGRRLQLDCRGEGSPTVVFQAGGDVLGALAWAPALDKVARLSRACAYSRAGVLWSDPAKGRFVPEDVARDLHAALAIAGEKPPYVLVGHSRGGLYNLIFAGLYRKDIAGLVFADASHPDQEARYAAAGVATGDYVSPAQELSLAFSWTGLMRLAPTSVDPSIAPVVRAYYPKSAAAEARETHARDATLEAAGQYRDLENWPVVVLARELPDATRAREAQDALNGYLLGDGGVAADNSQAARRETIWRSLQVDLSTWSSRGRLEIVPNSNHAFFFFRPDVVVAAVSDVLSAARLVKPPPASERLTGLRSRLPPYLP